MLGSTRPTMRLPWASWSTVLQQVVHLIFQEPVTLTSRGSPLGTLSARSALRMQLYSIGWYLRFDVEWESAIWWSKLRQQ